MKKLFLILLLIVSVVISKHSNARDIEVAINKNIETLFILYPLLDFCFPPVENSLWDAATLHFQEYKDHEAVKKLSKLIKRTGIDGPVGLMLQYSKLPHISLRYELDENTRLSGICNSAFTPLNL